MLAKPAFKLERNANMHDWSERMERYHDPRNRSNLYLFKASSSTEISAKVIDFLESITADGGKDDGKMRR